MPDIILASSSSQRKRILENAGIPFEVIVSDVDESPVSAFSYSEQLKDIALRKAIAVFDMQERTDHYIIVSADQNIFFHNSLFGKPKDIDEARQLIQSMQGSDEIYAYVGTTVLHISNSEIVELINEFDFARMRMDFIPSNELENYLATQSPLSKCGGINILDTPFLHLEEGKMSTASGMTVEYLTDMLSTI